MTTIIHSNGSKWGGESPDGIDALLKRLTENTLDPMFEHYGNFVYPQESNLPFGVRFFGNFFDYSHVFTIDSNDPEIVGALTKAIRANQQTEQYSKAREARIEQDRTNAARPYGDQRRADRWNRSSSA